MTRGVPEVRTSLRPPQLDASLDLLPCGWVSFDDDGNIIAANTTLATMLGAERDALVGRHIETLLTVGSRIFFQTHLYPLVRLHGHAEEVFVLLRHADGSDVGALLNAVRRTGGGRAVMECVLMEVRERRKFEDALLRSKQEAESARASLEARTRELEEANEKLEEQALELEFQPQQLQEQTSELEAQSEELVTANDELLARTEELEHARATAEEANRAKSQFLAVMSHELRTPLNAIGGYAQLMELGIHGPITEEQRGALERITGAQRHLLRLINEVLNLARIEAGRVEFTPERVVLADVVAAVMPMLEPQIAAAGLTSEANVDRALVATADFEKLQQILINLLTNAVKFTPAGGRITVSAEREAAGERVLVHVRDTGIGIPADKLERVFEPFVQVDSGRTRRKDGTGLGLAISRDLARGMHGELTARSVEGEGSTFTIALPAA
jgi:PAS domain S-box-containing protein